MALATVDELHAAAARLCRDYATAEPATLRDRGLELSATVTGLVNDETSPAERRELLAVAGWTSLLVSCVEYDMNLGEDAERSRRRAAWLGREAGNLEIVAWAFELGAWFALTRRRWRETIELAVAGQRIAPGTSAAVQLAAQEARAWARLGERRRSELAMERSQRILDALPQSADVEHHFVIDPAKTYYYRLDCHRWLGDDQLAEKYADEVLARWDRPPGAQGRKPMRAAVAQLSLGVVAVRAGDLAGATAAASAAIAQDRRCLPSFSLIAGELVDGVLARWPRHRRSAELIEVLREVVPDAIPPVLVR